MAIIIYYPYNAIDDEVYQFEAAQNLFKGHSYTTAFLGNDLSDPPRDWLKSWPIGYSFVLKFLMGLSLQLSAAAKLLKLSIFLIGIYFWRKIATNLLKQKDDHLMFMCMLLYTYIYISSSTTDMFLCSLFPLLIISMQQYYNSYTTTDHSSPFYSLIASSVVVSLFLLTKYTAIPLYISCLGFVLYTNYSRPYYCIRDGSVFSILPSISIFGIMLTNYLNSSKHTLTFIDAGPVNLTNAPHEIFSLLKHFIFSIETTLTSMMLIGRASFCLNGLFQPLFYHFASIFLLFIIVNAFVYVYKRINKPLVAWMSIACLTNIIFITLVTVVLVIRYGPFFNMMSDIHRYHYHLIPCLYVIIILWLRSKYGASWIYKYIRLALICISIIGFIYIYYDKQQKYSASAKLYNDVFGTISHIISTSGSKQVTAICDLSYIKLIRGEFDINLFFIGSSNLLSELNSKKYFSSPTILILLYEKSSIDSKLDKSLTSSGFSKTIASSTVIYQRFFEPGLLHLVQ